MIEDHYRTLEVAPTADQAELRAAYLRLARTHHPDLFDESQQAAADAKMREINEAWNVLGVPHKRKEYDSQRVASGEPYAGTAQAGPMRGNAHFQAFDDDPVQRADVDLDPTPLSGSRTVPRWVSLAPIALVVFGAVAFAFGLLVNAANIIAIAFATIAMGGVGFLLVPLVVMSRAERDPNL